MTLIDEDPHGGHLRTIQKIDVVELVQALFASVKYHTISQPVYSVNKPFFHYLLPSPSHLLLPFLDTGAPFLRERERHHRQLLRLLELVHQLHLLRV